MHTESSSRAGARAWRFPASWAGGVRLRGLLIMAPCAALLVTAWTLTADKSGIGTHQQLGLNGCSFLTNTGWPCPSCGMTTAFAASVRADWTSAFVAQPFGPVLVMVVAALAITGAAELLSGVNLIGRIRRLKLWLIVMLLGLLAGWGIKVWLGYINGLYPLR